MKRSTKLLATLMIGFLLSTNASSCYLREEVRIILAVVGGFMVGYPVAKFYLSMLQQEHQKK